MKRRLTLYPLLIFLILPTVSADEDGFEIKPWSPAFRGIEMTRGTRSTAAGPEAMTALRVDLKAEGVKFFATPDNGEQPLETSGETAPQFLRKHQLQIAFNTAFFTPCCSYFGTEPKDLIGYAISQGEKISNWSSSKPVTMAISRDHEVSFHRQEPQSAENLWFACAGMEVLKAGKPVTNQNDNRHPRTAAGSSADGRYLYFLFLDGRQPKHSIGASLHDTALWLRELGAHDGINFDGGGSTILVIDAGDRGPKILNRPSAGLPRVNGAHLGLSALSLR